MVSRRPVWVPASITDQSLTVSTVELQACAAEVEDKTASISVADIDFT